MVASMYYDDEEIIRLENEKQLKDKMQIKVVSLLKINLIKWNNIQKKRCGVSQDKTNCPQTLSKWYGVSFATSKVYVRNRCHITNCIFYTTLLSHSLEIVEHSQTETGFVTVFQLRF